MFLKIAPVCSYGCVCAPRRQILTFVSSLVAPHATFLLSLFAVTVWGGCLFHFIGVGIVTESTGGAGTHSADQADLKLRHPPASWMVGLKVWDKGPW